MAKESNGFKKLIQKGTDKHRGQSGIWHQRRFWDLYVLSILFLFVAGVFTLENEAIFSALIWLFILSWIFFRFVMVGDALSKDEKIFAAGILLIPIPFLPELVWYVCVVRPTLIPQKVGSTTSEMQK